MQTGFNAVVVAIFALAGLSPYIGLASTMIGLGTFGIVLLHTFARRSPSWRSSVATAAVSGSGPGVAPAVAGLVLSSVVGRQR